MFREVAESTAISLAMDESVPFSEGDTAVPATVDSSTMTKISKFGPGVEKVPAMAGVLRLSGVAGVTEVGKVARLAGMVRLSGVAVTGVAVAVAGFFFFESTLETFE